MGIVCMRMSDVYAVRILLPHTEDELKRKCDACLIEVAERINIIWCGETACKLRKFMTPKT